MYRYIKNVFEYCGKVRNLLSLTLDSETPVLHIKHEVKFAKSLFTVNLMIMAYK